MFSRFEEFEMSLSGTAVLMPFVGRTPWSAADALVGILLRTEEMRVQGDPRRTGVPPYTRRDWLIPISPTSEVLKAPARRAC